MKVGGALKPGWGCSGGTPAQPLFCPAASAPVTSLRGKASPNSLLALLRPLRHRLTSLSLHHHFSLLAGRGAVSMGTDRVTLRLGTKFGAGRHFGPQLMKRMMEKKHRRLVSLWTASS